MVLTVCTLMYTVPPVVTPKGSVPVERKINAAPLYASDSPCAVTVKLPKLMPDDVSVY